MFGIYETYSRGKIVTFDIRVETTAVALIFTKVRTLS
jgi:hypothetical protein